MMIRMDSSMDRSSEDRARFPRFVTRSGKAIPLPRKFFFIALYEVPSMPSSQRMKLTRYGHRSQTPGEVSAVRTLV